MEPKHIRELHQSIFDDGCNANTVIHYHSVVRKALQYAVKNEMISENTADKVDRPKKGKYLAALFKATKDDSMAVVIQLAAYYGLRRSEVLGIRWSAVDFERGTISINHKVTETTVDGKHKLYTEDKLKTKSSFRANNTAQTASLGVSQKELQSLRSAQEQLSDQGQKLYEDFTISREAYAKTPSQNGRK